MHDDDAVDTMKKVRDLVIRLYNEQMKIIEVHNELEKRVARLEAIESLEERVTVLEEKES